MKAMQPPQPPNLMFVGLDPRFNHFCTDNMSSGHYSLPLSASYILIARQSKVSKVALFSGRPLHIISQEMFPLYLSSQQSLYKKSSNYSRTLFSKRLPPSRRNKTKSLPIFPTLNSLTRLSYTQPKTEYKSNAGTLYRKLHHVIQHKRGGQCF